MLTHATKRLRLANPATPNNGAGRYPMRRRASSTHNRGSSSTVASTWKVIAVGYRRHRPCTAHIHVVRQDRHAPGAIAQSP
jgi:hypothetical protein